jgi:hypothetical protein
MALTYLVPNNTLNFAQGTLTATNDALTLGRFMTWNYVAFQLTGTWTGTVTFECSVDQVTWVTVSVTPSNSVTTVTTATGNGVWSVQNTGFAAVRARFSTASSGTLGVTIKSLPSQA